MENVDNLWLAFCQNLSADELAGNESALCDLMSPHDESTSEQHFASFSDFTDTSQQTHGSPLSSFSDSDEGSLCPVDGENQQNLRQTPQKRKRTSCPLKKSRQRHAANQRERRRMSSINDAFDGLRTHIPVSQADKKLSKVDTLRLAIQYIDELTQMLKTYDALGCGPQNGGNYGNNKKVIIRYPIPVPIQESDNYYSLETTECMSTTLVGHSLSWSAPSQDQRHPAALNQNKLTAKIWVPDQDNEAHKQIDATLSNYMYTQSRW